MRIEKFQTGKYSLKGESSPKRSVVPYETVLQTLVEQYPIVTFEKLTGKFELDYSTNYRHLRAI